MGSFLAPGSAHAQLDLILRPSWATSGLGEACVKPNSSYLSNTTRTADSDLERLKILDTSESQMHLEWQDLNRDFEMRKDYGIADQPLMYQHLDQLRQYAKGVLDRVKKYQTHEGVEKAKDLISKHPELAQTLKKPAAVAAIVAGVYTGQPMSTRVFGNTNVHFSTDIRDERGKVAVESPIVNGAVDLQPKAPDYDPFRAPPVDPTVGDERYRVALSRGIPAVGVDAGLAYGSSSASLTASLSKQLLSNLTCVVQSRRAIRDSDSRPGEDAVKVLYGMRF